MCKESLAVHVLQHQEMAGIAHEIERVLQSPTEMRILQPDQAVRLFYEFYAKTMARRWLVGSGSESWECTGLDKNHGPRERLFEQIIEESDESS
ncbi:MAG: hypothetical protein GDA68_15315 [Nitrospira sp. CR2.1]|nr:hypothetical protein [Nitrospira sp. CR2.1]